MDAVRPGLALAVAALALPACSSGPSGPADLVLSDFAIEVAAPLRAGPQVLTIANAGPTVHEVVFIRTDLDFDELPMTKDGQLLDEEGAGIEIVAADEFVAVGAQDVLDVDLTPGSYWLFCNIEGHFLGGMAVRQEVAP